MKELTRIEPEPQLSEERAQQNLNWLSKGITHGLQEHDIDPIMRLLIHKVNELTDEVNRIKNEKK